jgi:hypothetical protein
MRFGKKLALQVTEDHSGAPYLSHKDMKEAINKTVRELRLYQSKKQQLSEQSWRSGVMQPQLPEAASPEEIAELEAGVAALDHQLFVLVDEDLERILEHIRCSEAFLEQHIAALQASAVQMGMLMEESQAQHLEKCIPVPPENRTALCRQLLDLRIRSEPKEVKARLEEIDRQHNTVVEVANEHSQYLEINVAGFRKLLKRHEKQIPQQFHARPTPFLGFHRLVTHTSRQLLEIVRQLGEMLEEAWNHYSSIHPGSASSQSKAIELRCLGAECQMVLEIQKQLKDVARNPGLVVDALNNGGLYPKPGPDTGSVPIAAKGKPSQQQMIAAYQDFQVPAAEAKIWWPPPANADPASMLLGLSSAMPNFEADPSRMSPDLLASFMQRFAPHPGDHNEAAQHWVGRQLTNRSGEQAAKINNI